MNWWCSNREERIPLSQFMETSPWSENLRNIIHIPASLDKFIFVYHLIKYLVWRYPVFWKKACGLLFCYFKVAVLYSFLSWKYTSKWTNAIGKMPSSLPPPTPPKLLSFRPAVPLSPKSRYKKERGVHGKWPKPSIKCYYTFNSRRRDGCFTVSKTTNIELLGLCTKKISG